MPRVPSLLLAIKPGDRKEDLGAPILALFLFLCRESQTFRRAHTYMHKHNCPQLESQWILKEDVGPPPGSIPSLSWCLSPICEQSLTALLLVGLLGKGQGEYRWECFGGREPHPREGMTVFGRQKVISKSWPWKARLPSKLGKQPNSSYQLLLPHLPQGQGAISPHRLPVSCCSSLIIFLFIQ